MHIMQLVPSIGVGIGSTKALASARFGSATMSATMYDATADATAYDDEHGWICGASATAFQPSITTSGSASSMCAHVQWLRTIAKCRRQAALATSAGSSESCA